MPNPPRTVPFVRSLAAWLIVPGMLACGAENLKPGVPAEPEDVYWSLTLNHHAVTLGTAAQYDTVTLTATPRNVAGQALAGLPVPQYISRDVSRLVVTPDGVVRALSGGGEPVWVVARLVTGNILHMDSARVRALDVAPPLPVLTTLSVQPVPPDSAKRAIGTDAYPLPPLPVAASDADGAPMNDVMVAFHSSNPAVSVIDELTGTIHPVSLGTAMFSASAAMFGVTKTDSVRYRIGRPVIGSIGVPWLTGASDTLTLQVGVGAIISWRSPGTVQSATAFQVDFEPAALANVAAATTFSEFNRLSLRFFCLFATLDCDGAGNIATAPPSRAGAARVFTAPGTYRFTVQPDNLTGRIVVVDER